jgi:hypothetical protein
MGEFDTEQLIPCAAPANVIFAGDKFCASHAAVRARMRTAQRKAAS